MNLVLMPPLISLLTAVVAVAAWNRPRLQLVFSIGGAGALAATAAYLLWKVVGAGTAVLQTAGWPAPYGITLIADPFSSLLLVTTAVVALAVILHATAGLGETWEGFHPLVHFMLAGACGVLLAGDAFNLYVWFELMLIASFVLLAMGKAPQLSGGFKYLALNFLASMLFLAGVGLIYGISGTLNFAHLASLIKADETGPLIFPAVFLLAGLGIKSALFPFYFWLPASYHNPVPAVSALVAALLTKIGIYALIRCGSLIFSPLYLDWRDLVLVIAACTLLAGALGAVVQEDFRRVLAFLVVSHSGYLLLGLGFFSLVGLAGTAFFTVHLILTNAALFLVAGMIRHEGGSYRLTELGGLFRGSPWLTVLFLLPVLSLAEIPPLPGFWGKLMLLKAGLEGKYYLSIAAAVVANLLTIYALVKIWNEAFWKAKDEGAEEGELPPRIRDSRALQLFYYLPVGFLGLCILLLGLFPEPLGALSLKSAHWLLDIDAYIEIVLGGAP